MEDKNLKIEESIQKAKKQKKFVYLGFLLAVVLILVGLKFGIIPVKDDNYPAIAYLASVGSWVFLLSIIYFFILKIYIKSKELSKQVVCTKCGSTNKPKKYTRGSIGIEIILWLFLIPGLIYSLWRMTTKGLMCSDCKGKDTFVPTDSPIGMKLMSEK